MTRVATGRLREDLSTLLNRVAFGKERVIVCRRDKDLVAVVPIEDLELLKKLEDYVDLEEALAALSEPGRNVPYGKVRKELGLE